MCWPRSFGALGWLVGALLPGEPGFWAPLGMAAMLGGTMRAPLTGALFAIDGSKFKAVNNRDEQSTAAKVEV